MQGRTITFISVQDHNGEARRTIQAGKLFTFSYRNMAKGLSTVLAALPTRRES